MAEFGYCLRTQRRWLAVACSSMLLTPSRAVAEVAGQADTHERWGAELSWLLGDADLLNDRPGAGHGAPFDVTSRRATGRENRLLFELSVQRDGFLPRLETAAKVRLELNLEGRDQERALPFRDAGTSLALGWRATRALGVRLRLFPFDTDYVRLGYLRSLDWGGTDSARFDSIFVQNRAGAPGAELSLETPRASLCAGVKWATPVVAQAGGRPLWGLWLKGSLALLAGLRVDSGLGYFEQGELELQDQRVQGFAEGASVRVVWHRGPSEPELAPEPFLPGATGPDGLVLPPLTPTKGFALAAEGALLVQRLRNFEDPRSSRLVPGPAAAVYGSLGTGAWAAHAAVVGRSLAFVLRNSLGLAGAQALPAHSVALPELGGWIGAAFTWTTLDLTAGVELGLVLPAAVELPSVLPGHAQTFVVRGPGSVEPLPVGARRLPVAAGRVSLRWDASSLLSLALFAEYERDANRTGLRQQGSLSLRAFAPADRVGLGGLAQARF